MDRVKSLRQKRSTNSFDPPIPIGTDGVLVDMLSGLDNEQELKLGGNHSSTITENGNTTTIVELYKDITNNTTIYRVETTIIENADESTNINIVLKDGSNTVLRRKAITIPADAATITIGEVLS